MLFFIENFTFFLWQTDSSDHEDEGDVPMAQRKKFTRVEMARVLMERNQVTGHGFFDFLNVKTKINFVFV